MGVDLESPVSASGLWLAVAPLARVFLELSEPHFFLIYKMDVRKHLPRVAGRIKWDNS